MSYNIMRQAADQAAFQTAGMYMRLVLTSFDQPAQHIPHRRFEAPGGFNLKRSINHRQYLSPRPPPNA